MSKANDMKVIKSKLMQVQADLKTLHNENLVLKEMLDKVLDSQKNTSQMTIGTVPKWQVNSDVLQGKQVYPTHFDARKDDYITIATIGKTFNWNSYAATKFLIRKKYIIENNQTNVKFLVNPQKGIDFAFCNLTERGGIRPVFKRDQILQAIFADLSNQKVNSIN